MVRAGGRMVAGGVRGGTRKEWCGQVDVWSLGVCVYGMLCGFAPFYDESRPALFKKVAPLSPASSCARARVEEAAQPRAASRLPGG